MIQVKKQLLAEFNIKDLEEVKIITGWGIKRNFQTETLKIDQKVYI